METDKKIPAKTIVTVVVFPLMLALFATIVDQGWCRFVSSRQFNSLCAAELQGQLRTTSSVYATTASFLVAPHLVSQPEQTLLGVEGQAAYELKLGAGARDYYCTCTCGVFTKKVSIAIN